MFKKIFKKKQVKKIDKVEILIDILIKFFQQLIDSRDIKTVNIRQYHNIIQGLELRKDIINGKLVYDRSIISLANGIRQLTQEQKQLVDKCLYTIQKIFYKLNE